MTFLRFTVLVMLMSVLVACSSQDAPADNGASGDNTSETVTTNNTNPENAGLVARVNGTGITLETYNDAFERRSVYANAASESALRQQVLDELVEQELIRQGAPGLGISVTDEDIEAEIAAQREIAGSEDAWLASLEQNDYTQEEWFEAQRDVLITQGVSNILIEPYLGEIEQVNARHILVRTEATANEVMDRLEAGEGFATLAAEYSLDTTTANNGGNLGWFARNELYQQALEDRAFELEIGAISYVTTSLGYHVVQTMAREVREVEFERLAVLSENVFNNWLNTQYRNATIEVYVQW